MQMNTSVVAEGLVFPEGPRWREDRLWFSDMQLQAVMTLDGDGRLNKILELDDSPSGLGWLPDGRLLVVSMIDRRLLRLDPDGLVEVADLNALASFHCNDMVVDRRGNAYIGNFGFNYAAGETPKPAQIIQVTPEGRARVAARDVLFPNGMVITPDGKMLIAAETFGNRLTAFDIHEDGSLTGQRTWAALEGVFPDGICLDSQGGVWVAAPRPGQVLRVTAGGIITDRVTVSTQPYACMLGGPDRLTLYVCTSGPAVSTDAGVMPGGRIEAVEVDIPGAGLP